MSVLLRFHAILVFIVFIVCSSSVQAQLNGTYTVGGTTPDYATIGDALVSLGAIGVSGPVVFALRDGVYNEQITTTPSVGASAINTITWQSESGDSTAVTIQNLTGSVIDFINSNWVFHQLTFSGPQSGSAAHIIDFSSGTNTKFSNCIINAHPTQTGLTNNAGIYAVNTDLLTVENCVINGAGYGLYASGSNSANSIDHTTIRGNKITGAKDRGISIQWHLDGLIVEDNVVDCPANGTIGIYLGTVIDTFSVQRNQILVEYRGLSMAGCEDNGAGRPTVANNFVSVSVQAGTADGIYMTGTTNIDLCNNSIHVDATLGGGFAMQVGPTNAGMNVRNNSFVCLSAGEPVYFYGSTINYDYCNFYTGNGFTYTMPPNSVSVDPIYASISDLHLNTNSLNGLGISLAEVPFDIDGEARNVITPDIGADEYTPPSNDAGTAFQSPAICGSGSDVTVHVENFGSATLTSLTIQWEVNGTGQTPFNWTGNLAPSGVEAVIVGQAAGSNLNITAWSELPNGQPDTGNGNDTSSIANTNPGLSGTYTVGGLSPDYGSINSAVSALYTYGVCGATTFNIRLGSYHEVIYMNGGIDGSSASNTVTFQSENGDSTSVEIWRDFPDTDVHVWRMDDVSNITLRSLHIHNRGTLSNKVVMSYNCSNTIIENCSLEGNPSATSSGTVTVLAISDPGSDIVVRNSFIRGGYSQQMTVVGNGSLAGNVLVDNNIVGNIIVDQINGIHIFNNKTGHIFFQDCDGDYRIENNVFDGFGSEAIYLLSSNAGRARIVNNTMKMTTAWNVNMWAIRCIGSSNIDFLHNTIEFNSTANYDHHFCLYVDGSNNLNLYNNNFVKRGYGKVLRLFNSSGNNSDYNNFYAESGEINYNVTSLAQWQSVMGLDSNSVSVDPLFSTALVDSLFPTVPAVMFGGTPLQSVLTDIHGTTRNAVAPFIGAFELLSAPIVNLGPDTTVCDALTLNAWNPSSQFVWSTGDTTQTISIATSGTYWVEATNAEGTDRDTVVITINLTPIITLPDSATICAGDSLLLDPQSTASNYSWTTGQSTATIYTQNTGWTGVTASNGTCAATDSTFIVSILTLQVNLGNDTAMCQGNTVLLDAGNLGASYQWSTGDTTQTIVANMSGGYYVNVSDQCGTITDTVVVTVNLLPSITIAGDDSICAGTSATLTASGASAYQWSGGPATPNHVVSPSVSATYSVAGTDNNGCIDSTTHFMYVGALPLVSITGDTAICIGETATLTGNNGNNHTWSNGEVTQEIYVTPITTQSYTLTITEPDGCSDSATVQVTVNPLPPTPTITQNGPDLVSSVASTYTWYDSNSNVVGNNQTFTPSVNGEYGVIVTDANGCTSAAALFDFWWLGVDEYQRSEINIFPNPTDGIITIRSAEAIRKVTVTDALGRVVYQQETQQANQSLTIDLTPVPAGHYLIFSETMDATRTASVIIR